METVLTREHIELSGEECVSTDGAFIRRLNRDEAVLKVLDVSLDGLGAPGGFVHLRF